MNDILNIVTATVMFTVVSILIGLLLALSDKYLQVQVDERYQKVYDMLPHLDCGACGYPGCAGMTEGLLSGDAKQVSRCKPSKPAQRQAIKDYLANTPGPDGKTIIVDL